jgi:hypothetical protein
MLNDAPQRNADHCINKIRYNADRFGAAAGLASAGDDRSSGVKA